MFAYTQHYVAGSRLFAGTSRKAEKSTYDWLTEASKEDQCWLYFALYAAYDAKVGPIISVRRLYHNLIAFEGHFTNTAFVPWGQVHLAEILSLNVITSCKIIYVASCQFLKDGKP